ncbi:MAG: hypothetical protein A2506_07995, partial [Elusimicrobia bacterium RIFOXYD12_FULL_66_9]
DEDLTAARDLMACGSGSHRVLCFCCQQAAEKYLKALLVKVGLPVPKTHDLVAIMMALGPFIPDVEQLSATDAAWLTGFAVGARYPLPPAMAVTGEHADRALAIAQTIKQFCLAEITSNAK